MPFVGLDVHKRVVEAVVLHDDGRIQHRERFPCTREELVRFGKRHLGPSARVACGFRAIVITGIAAS